MDKICNKCQLCSICEHTDDIEYYLMCSSKGIFKLDSKKVKHNENQIHIGKPDYREAYYTPWDSKRKDSRRCNRR